MAAGAGISIMFNDPRIRGVCPVPSDPKVRVRPTIDRCAGVPLGTSVRCGSIVKIRSTGEILPVQHVNYYSQAPTCRNLPAQRIVMALDLGGEYTRVSWDLVDVIKY